MATDLFSDATAPSFDDPLGMLAACHGRIERQLATLERLQRHLPEHGCDVDARAAARGILRYFDTAAPNHHADEEASVFPRLRNAVPGRADSAGRRPRARACGARRAMAPPAAAPGRHRRRRAREPVAERGGRCPRRLCRAHRAGGRRADPARRPDLRRGDPRGHRQRDGGAPRHRSGGAGAGSPRP